MSPTGEFENVLDEVDQLQQRIRSLRPLQPEEALQLKEYYRIGLTYTSNALEGNTLTETETKVVLEDGITIGGKPIRDHLEAIGHSKAFDWMYELVQKDGVTESDILALHQLFFNEIDAQYAGRYRDQKIIVTGSKYVFPLPAQVPSLMTAFVASIPSLQLSLHPVMLAAALHRELVTIHPFIDGNGRVARLLMNLALLKNGYPIAIIPPVLRSQYIDAVHQSNFGQNEMFTHLVIDMVYEAQKDFLRMIDRG